MIKTINFELSKRLNEEGILDNIETEYYFEYIRGHYILENDNTFQKGTDLKTLTLEEAIDLLPNEIRTDWFDGNIVELQMGKRLCGYYDNELLLKETQGKTLLEAVELMLEFLLEENLLNNK